MRSMPTPRRWLSLLAVLLGFALVAAACGSDDDDSSTADEDKTETGDQTGDGDADTGDNDVAASAAITVTDSAGAEITLEAAPERIVSLSPTATEMLFAIGAGDLVVAADDYSNYPEDAPTTDLSGFSPNLEAIIGYDPQLVVIQSDSNDLVAGLEAAGIPAVQQFAAASLDDAYAQIELLGTVTGHSDEASEVVAEMKTDMAALLAKIPERDTPITFFHEVDSTYYSLTSNTFAGQLYEMAGFENIADAADNPDSGGYPQLTAEYIIEADPDVIFLADTKFENQSAATVAARDGWGGMSAVVADRVFELNDDIVSRWGPRLVEYFEIIVEASLALELEPAS